MTEPEKPGENFLERWSRLKQESGAGVRAHTEPPQSEHAEFCALPDINAQSDNAQSDPPAFDPSSLPPIDSITAASDIRAFLAPGVPEELSRAALRRAWVVDPTIRNFVGIAENQWDFTRPDDVPGFGSLDVTAELRRMITQLVDPEARLSQAADNPVEPDARRESEVEATKGPGAVHNCAEPASDRVLFPRQTEVAEAATEKEPLDAARTARRKHGGALPR
jgi:hypothetical protein